MYDSYSGSITFVTDGTGNLEIGETLNLIEQLMQPVVEFRHGAADLCTVRAVWVIPRFKLTGLDGALLFYGNIK